MQMASSFCLRPPLVDLLQGDFLGVVKGLYQPDVFVYLVFGYASLIVVIITVFPCAQFFFV